MRDGIIAALNGGAMPIRPLVDAMQKNGFQFKTRNPVNSVGAYLYSAEALEHFTRKDGTFMAKAAAVTQHKEAVRKDLGLCATQILTNHQLAKNCAAQSVLYAAKCGALMNKAKEIVGHGNFGPWLKKNCPTISRRTCTNYLALAESIKAKMATVANLPKELTLLDLPDPRDLKNDDNNRLITAVKKVTNNKTLSQLYTDFNIVKKATKAEEAKEKLGARTGNRVIDGAAEARVFVDGIEEKLANAKLFDKEMSDDDRNRLVDVLMSTLRTLGVPVTIQKAA